MTHDERRTTPQPQPHISHSGCSTHASSEASMTLRLGIAATFPRRSFRTAAPPPPRRCVHKAPDHTAAQPPPRVRSARAGAHLHAHALTRCTHAAIRPMRCTARMAPITKAARHAAVAVALIGWVCLTAGVAMQQARAPRAGGGVCGAMRRLRRGARSGGATASCTTKQRVAPLAERALWAAPRLGARLARCVSPWHRTRRCARRRAAPPQHDTKLPLARPAKNPFAACAAASSLTLTHLTTAPPHRRTRTPPHPRTARRKGCPARLARRRATATFP
jgi:hypothetical protein